MTAASIALALAAPNVAMSKTFRHDSAIAQARQRTHACQRQLGIKLTPVSGKPVHGKRYARWVLTLWRSRAKAYCRLARELTDVGILARIVDPCLAAIVERESGWQVTVYNRQGSGAYGLPQALPGDKMRSAGEDWRTNPLTQLRWLAGYARRRYGSSCGALAFHRANGWY